MASRAPGFGGARALEMVARPEESPLGLLLLTVGSRVWVFRCCRQVFGVARI